MTTYILFVFDLVIGSVCAVIIFSFWRYYIALRKERKLIVCNQCTEFKQDGICSGFKKQAIAIRKFEEEASLWKMAKGYIPKVIKK